MARSSTGPAQARSASETVEKENGDVAEDGNGAIAHSNASEIGVSRAGNVVTKARTGPATARTGATAPAAGGASELSGQARREANSGPRFHIFVIDSGWNSVASKVLQENLDLIRDLNSDDQVFFVGRDASIALLRKYAWQIGRDPIISVHDMRPIHRHRVHHSHGFRMHLGILQDEKEVLSSLQMFARFLKMNRSVADVEAAVRKTLRQEGLSGAIQVIGGSATSHLMEKE